jgi:rhodanese-related sulfurtransferase
MTSRIDRMLDNARGRLRRLSAREVSAALDRGAVLVDIRPQAQRAREGGVPAALVIERNVLEWRCDPTSDARLPQAVDDAVEWVVLCSEGFTSSLAAASLKDLGLHRATDVVGGYRALEAEGVLAELAEREVDARSEAVAGGPPACEGECPQAAREKYSVVQIDALVVDLDAGQPAQVVAEDVADH